MYSIPIPDPEIAQKANYHNVIQSVFSREDETLVIENNWGQPQWRKWWERYHDAGGKLFATEQWPDEPPQKPEKISLEDRVKNLENTNDQLISLLKSSDPNLAVELDKMRDNLA